MGEFDGNYVTLVSVRRTVGIDSTNISDADVKAIIDEVEPQISRYLNTEFTPTEKIEVVNGNGTNRMFTTKNPLLAVRDLYINGDQEDTANLNIYKGSGKIILDFTKDLTNSTFREGNQKVRIKYIYGWLEESSTSTTTDAASTAGTSVALSVASESGFTTNDWVEVYGMDGKREVAQITGTGTGELTVDQLTQTHESGSVVVLLQIQPLITKLMNIVCALAMVARIVGESFTDIVGYTMGEFQVQKGEPFTQWRETAKQLEKERDDILSRVWPRPSVI